MTVRKKRNKNKKKHFRWILLFSILLFLIPLNLLFNLSVNLTSIKPLKIPIIAKTFLPEGLKISPFNPNVLGAEIIDPNDFVKYVNQEREKTGSIPLRMNVTLMKGAKMRADTILKHQNFSHQDPYENITMVTALSSLGYNYIYASENIGMGGSSGEDFVGGFMHSYYHRENLLNPQLTETGVAIVTGPYDRYYVNIAVQLFAIPAGKNEYLGYSDQERENYARILTTTRLTLNPLIWNINKLLGKKEFNLDKYNRLKIRENIISQLYAKMENGRPFEDKDVALVLEYNGLI